MALQIDDRNEWLEADGLGGFASGTLTGARTRRYHALLLPATTPPTGRVVLVNGLEAWVDGPAGHEALSTQLYVPDVRHPDGERRIIEFEAEPWPTWRYRLADGRTIVQELFVPRGHAATIVQWMLEPAKRTSGAERAEGDGAPVRLYVRPLLSGRDIHATHHENPAFRFDAEVLDTCLFWRPYLGLPAIAAASNGSYRHDPTWYRNFCYEEERARGLDFVEDLASPGVFSFDLTRAPAALLLATGDVPWLSDDATSAGVSAAGNADEDGRRDANAFDEWLRRTRSLEKMRRGRLRSRLDRAADAYLVRGQRGRTIIAGYPWFTDWGRDTFTALRGLCIETDRLADAREILLSWAGEVSEGMLPNRFVEQGDAPEFNSVDAALWYIIAVDAYTKAVQSKRRRVRVGEQKKLDAAVLAILEGYAAGTRHGIRMDEDGLLAAGTPGLQLTWMDAKVGDHVITPRIGKPVEIQALWLNALAIGARLDERWKEPLERGRSTFPTRFWNADGGCLHDVVDVEHVRDTADSTFRPNQIFAVGGLPLTLLDAKRARSVVDRVEERLLTPLGPRSLAPGEPGYTPRYQGGVAERDGAYHQGTVWPWLIGPFVDAWLRVRGNGAQARTEARHRFVEPLLRHLDEAGIGHVSEIADADAPHTPRGCPFQAWSVAELIRVERLTRNK